MEEGIINQYSYTFDVVELIVDLGCGKLKFSSTGELLIYSYGNETGRSTVSTVYLTLNTLTCGDSITRFRVIHVNNVAMNLI